MPADVFLTEDGSHSLRSSENAAVTYHSTHGAINESRHVFIEAGLRPLLESGQAEIRIVEMGFGTGLNALLTLRELADYPAVRIHFDAYEKFPIPPAQAGRLNYPGRLGISSEVFLQLHRAAHGRDTILSDRFHFRLHQVDFLRAPAPPACDLIYYDAFAPEEQPELWTVAAMEQCAAWLRPGGRLVTYCAKGQFKRNLRAAGFRVRALPGPVGKREITRADLIDLAQLSVELD